MKTEESILKDAMDKWGFPSQRLIWIEELSELIQSLAKLGRNINSHSVERVEEEIADVDICLAQMKLYFPEWEGHRKIKMQWLVNLMEEDENGSSGWDMFCEEHYKEAMKHIQNKYPEHSVGYGKAIRDEEFDTDESMRCRYPECTKESKYEVHWIKFERL